MPTNVNIADYGAVGGRIVTGVTITMSTASTTITCATDLWTAADEGKLLYVFRVVDGTVDGENIFFISTFNNPRSVIVSAPPNFNLAGVSTRVIIAPNSTTAFENFNAAYAGQSDIVLTVPAGFYAVFGGVAKGLAQCTVLAYGASFHVHYTTFGSGVGSGVPFPQADGTALFHNVAVGEDFATLITSSESNRFTVGQVCLIGMQDLQAGQGFPPNLQFYQYVRVTSAAAGVVHFTPAAAYPYLETYPNYGNGSLTSSPEGGAARLWGMSPSFDCDVSVFGVEFIGNGFALSVSGMKIHFEDCFGNNDIPTITACNDISYKNCTFPGRGVEVDKVLGTVSIDGGTYFKFFCQSSAPRNFNVSNATFTGDLPGTPSRLECGRNTTITNCTISWLYCSVGYGAAESLTCTNTNVINNLTFGCNAQDVAQFTINDGVIAQPGGNIVNLQAVSVAPSEDIFVGFFPYSGRFRISDVTSDGSVPPVSGGLNTVHVHTDLPAGTSFPAIKPRSSDNKLFIGPHPCPRINVSDCPIGLLKGFDHALARNRPVFEYMNNQYTASDFATSGGQLGGGGGAWGEFVSLKVNVLTPYTGMQPDLTFRIFTSGLPPALTVDRASRVLWDPFVDLTVIGERTVTPTSVSNIKPHDVDMTPQGLILFGDGWQSQLSRNVRSEDPSVWPIFTLEVITNQGITTTPQITLNGPSTVLEGSVTTDYTVRLSAVGLGAGASMTFTLDSASGTAIQGVNFSALVSAALVAATNVALSGITTDPDGTIHVTATNTSGSDLSSSAPLLTFPITTIENFITTTLNFTVTLASATVAILNATITTSITFTVQPPTVDVNPILFAQACL